MIINHMRAMASWPLHPELRDQKVIDRLSAEFSNDGYAKITSFFNQTIFDLLLSEVSKIRKHAVRRDMVMPGLQTPRNLSVISGDVIMESSFLIPALYLDKDLNRLISKIVRSPVFNIFDPNEMIVINILENQADSHGWHLDDPQFALVIVLESPAPHIGGSVELIKEWRAFCAGNQLNPEAELETGVKEARKRNKVRKFHCASGEAYLIDAASGLHRVTPLNEPSSRTVINMAFHSDLRETRSVTASILYGDGTSSRDSDSISRASILR